VRVARGENRLLADDARPSTSSTSVAVGDDPVTAPQLHAGALSFAMVTK